MRCSAHLQRKLIFPSVFKAAKYFEEYPQAPKEPLLLVLAGIWIWWKLFLSSVLRQGGYF